MAAANEKFIKTPQRAKANWMAARLNCAATQKTKVTPKIIPLQRRPRRRLLRSPGKPIEEFQQRLAIISLRVNRRAAIRRQMGQKLSRPRILDPGCLVFLICCIASLESDPQKRAFIGTGDQATRREMVSGSSGSAWWSSGNRLKTVPEFGKLAGGCERGASQGIEARRLESLALIEFSFQRNDSCGHSAFAAAETIFWLQFVSSAAGGDHSRRARRARMCLRCCRQAAESRFAFSSRA